MKPLNTRTERSMVPAAHWPPNHPAFSLATLHLRKENS